MRDTEPQVLTTADDVTPEVVGWVHAFIDAGWSLRVTASGHTLVADWGDWIDRFESQHEIDLGSDLLSGAILKIKDEARKHLRNS